MGFLETFYFLDIMHAVPVPYVHIRYDASMNNYCYPISYVHVHVSTSAEHPLLYA